LISHQSYYQNGQIILPKELIIPEGSKVLVTVLENPSTDDFFLKASESSLENIWNNDEEDVYEQLLKK